MKIEKLNWDTDFFGLKIGLVIISNNTEFDIFFFKEEASKEKYDLIYVFKYQEMFPWETVLKAELELVDIQITMAKQFKKDDYINTPFEFRTELTESEKNQCYVIADETSIVSRFYREKTIGPMTTKKLYRKWIDNALNQSFSDGLFLHKTANSVTGIHLIRTDVENNIGYFTLTGVNPEFKRIGIGHKLWMQSFAYWANNSKIDMIKSPFSFNNSESFNFHLKMGFNRIEETKYIYHFHNKG